jgi:perosamine synthetase
MCDMVAALGTVQMRRLDELLAKRDRVARWYQQRLADERRVSMPRVLEEVRPSWFVFVVRLSDDYTPAQRDAMLKRLRAQGIGCNVYFPPIHLQRFYRERFGYKPGDFPVTEALAARTIALPFHNHLTEGEVDHVVQTLAGLL